MIEQKEVIKVINDLRIEKGYEKSRVYAHAYTDALNDVIESVNNLTSSKDSKPILITPEWLERFGFEDDGLTGSVRSYNLWWRSKEDEDYWLIFRYKFLLDKKGNIKKQHASVAGVYFPHIKHVHQLQNFFLATTGEKLELKQ